ncbi:esterase [Alicyclobacillus acidoterrestris]|uniref:alpha/beta hydrolase n=1 Tax=Alicyclobacillus suci TaxID=2816080 RepID=UPI00118F4972|nr:alpha/beta hydrolase-fold protein [Alicyclobacillus suci]GEO26119.1 esterase [Alicyclobacillus acidoterrestris]
MTNTPQRKIESHTIYSRHLNEERAIKVFVPHSYDQSKPLPIVYCHDGLEFFTHGRVATIANELMTKGEIPPFLIAGIAVNLEQRHSEYAMDGARHTAYQQFVVDECMPMLDSLYAVDDNARLMAGISLGAVASLSFMLAYPQYFHTLILFSGAYFPPVQARLRDEPDLSRLAAYLFIGDEERQAKTPSGVYNFYEYNEQMRDILLDRGAEVEFHVGPGNHIWGVWQKQLPDALRWLGRHLDV